jgi:hypothetical protein
MFYGRVATVKLICSSFCDIGPAPGSGVTAGRCTQHDEAPVTSDRAPSEGAAMTDRPGVPARELSDEELERQGVHAHAMRHWVFLHGTAEQFRTHTERMLELEQEYLRRHPQRTWQGTDGGTATLSRDDRIRDLVQTFSRAVTALLDEEPSTASAGAEDRRDPDEATTALLRRFAEAPGGRLHKLEAHQIARQLTPDSHIVARLYRQDPPLLQAERDMRVITDAGRAWLEAHSVPA